MAMQYEEFEFYHESEDILAVSHCLGFRVRVRGRSGLGLGIVSTLLHTVGLPVTTV